MVNYNEIPTELLMSHSIPPRPPGSLYSCSWGPDVEFHSLADAFLKASLSFPSEQHQRRAEGTTPTTSWTLDRKESLRPIPFVVFYTIRVWFGDLKVYWGSRLASKATCVLGLAGIHSTCRVKTLRNPESLCACCHGHEDNIKRHSTTCTCSDVQIASF